MVCGCFVIVKLLLVLDLYSLIVFFCQEMIIIEFRDLIYIIGKDFSEFGYDSILEFGNF